MVPPKAILFDVGGVVVSLPYPHSPRNYPSLSPSPSPSPQPPSPTNTPLPQVLSPFQAILDYELENRIPTGYINAAIQAGPRTTGAWQLLERGAVPLDASWFAAFHAQLSRPDIWRKYWLAWSARGGGHADSTAPLDAAQVPPVPRIEAEKLFWRMMRYSRRADPWMYPALKRLREVGGRERKWVVGALSNTVDFPVGIVDDGGVVFEKGVLFEAGGPHEGDEGDEAGWGGV
ncbi:hypothetical protein GRF29_44g870874 [Pseudopithomyces chartarum]|uniref:HAD-like protein n=1 Tax=Pseudopithomyces chartarum TaxID=1892770 RepID=A0AAN6RHT9_9PLEO|nr:hypothetical protein GRF29_44g870874 [Pseudopithomyces chartarum]